MIKKYSKSQANFICILCIPFSKQKQKIKKIFFKTGYNWYKFQKCCIPTLIRSNLYPRAGYNWLQKIQMCKKASVYNDLRDARI